MAGNNGTLRRWLGQGPAQRVPDLGQRELDVLEVLWAKGECSAQEVREALPGKTPGTTPSKTPSKTISLSTVQSTLERLHRKALLAREKSGRAFRYQAQVTRTELIGGLLRDLAADVAGGDVAPMLSGFLDYVSAEAPELGANVSRALAGAALEEPEHGDD